MLDTCKFTTLRLHSEGKKYAPFDDGITWRLQNEDGQRLVGTKGKLYSFVTEQNAREWLFNNLSRTANKYEDFDSDYLKQIGSTFIDTGFEPVRVEFETLVDFNENKWKPVIDYGCDDSEQSGALVPDYVYKRNPNWLPMPTIADGEEKAVMLVRISEAQPFFNAARVDGDVTIDWGDGTIENLASGSAPTHLYDFNNPALHDTVSELGYKQAIVTITPQIGNNITRLSIGSTSTNDLGVCPIVMDCEIQCPELVTVNFGGQLRAGSLERIKIGTNKVGNWWQAFMVCRSLKVAEVDHSQATNLSSCYEHCYQLKSVTVNAPLATNLESTFRYCYDLEKIKVLNVPLASHCKLSFNGCVRLKAINTDEPKAIINLDVTPASFENIFNGTGLSEIEINNPVADKATRMYGFVASAKHLKVINIQNTLTPNNLDYAFQYVDGILDWDAINVDGNVYCDKQYTFRSASCKRVPSWINFSGYRLSGMFNGCDLEESPNLSFTSDAKVDRIFGGCNRLKKVGDFQTSKSFHTNNYLFTSTRVLESIGAVDVGKINLPSMANAYTLTKVDIFNINQSVNFTNCNLSASEIDKIFNNLLPATGQTITVTGCPGANDCDVSIAVNKGWSVGV